MPLEIVQWRWDANRRPFQSIAFYHPTEQLLKDVDNISWHTPNNSVSSRGLGAGARAGLARAFLSRRVPEIPDR